MKMTSRVKNLLWVQKHTGIYFLTSERTKAGYPVGNILPLLKKKGLIEERGNAKHSISGIEHQTYFGWHLTAAGRRELLP